jgi:hypothetical protein
MLFQPFALGIVNDLFDEDLDPDLFREAADEAPADLPAGERDVLLDALRPTQPVRPFFGADDPRPRRLS